VLPFLIYQLAIPSSYLPAPRYQAAEVPPEWPNSGIGFRTRKKSNAAVHTDWLRSSQELTCYLA